MKYILALLLLTTSSVYAQGTAPTKLIFLNECPDLAPGDVYHSGMSAEEYVALTERWECLNRTQASQRQEIFEKVWAASYNVKQNKLVVICSIDPKRIKGDYYFGAWKSRIRGCDIDYADMPGCKNAQKKLQKLLKTLGYASK